MNQLQQKAPELRFTLSRQGRGQALEDSGIRLITFPRPEGELRFTWNVYEDSHILDFSYETRAMTVLIGR